MRKKLTGFRCIKAAVLFLTVLFLFTSTVHAEYIYDIDNTIVDQIDWNTKTGVNEYKSRVREYLMLPTEEECIEWEIDTEILEDMEPFYTNFNGINNQMISLMERYWKRGYYLPAYDLRSAICAFNFITNNPGHDYRVILNYPVDGRKYTFLNMDLFTMDYQEVIKMRKFRGINIDIRRGMVDETVKFFYDWTPSVFEPPVIVQDYGLYPTKKIRYDYETRQYYGWVNNLKDECYIYYLEGKEKRGIAAEYLVLLREVRDEILGVRDENSEFYDPDYETKIWRQATYSSRFYIADIMNGLVGTINNNELKKTKTILKPEAKASSRDTVKGVLLISEIMNKMGYQTAAPGRTEVERILKYSDLITGVANQNSYYRYCDQYAFQALREEIALIYGETFTDIAWRHTVAYLVTANAVN